MLIDCDSCIMEGTAACHDCIVPVLLDGFQAPVAIIDEEARALQNLAEAGLVAPLRLVRRARDTGTG